MQRRSKGGGKPTRRPPFEQRATLAAYLLEKQKTCEHLGEIGSVVIKFQTVQYCRACLKRLRVSKIQKPENPLP